MKKYRIDGKSGTALENVRRGAIAAICCLALSWVLAALQRVRAEEYREIETRLLRTEGFGLAELTRIAGADAGLELDACDTHSQRTVLLAEMPLADSSLRSGNTGEFDRHIERIERRSRRILSCAPRDSLAWLVLFSLEVTHGRLTDRAFKMLERSYESSPNESWIAVRRVVVAMPVILLVPEPLRSEILREFRSLIRNRLIDDAARSFVHASQRVRLLLLAEVGKLDVADQRAFSEILLRLGA
jgi:muconolactone delta-isomerase